MREPGVGRAAGWSVWSAGYTGGCKSTDDTEITPHNTWGWAGGRSRAARHDPALRLILRRRNPASACYTVSIILAKKETH